MRIDHARDQLAHKMNWIKSNVLKHDPDDPAILHRNDIIGFKGHFGCLKDDRTHDLFDRAVIRLMKASEYSVITALIDKQWLLKQQHWKNTHPYHYLMEILIEKYVQFLERQGATGDIMPESRGGNGKGKVDERLQRACDEVRATGTYYVSRERIENAMRGQKLKFRTKKDNIAGLQLCDLIAHPSHYFVRGRMNHAVQPGQFCLKVQEVLENAKYDRSANGIIAGYGIKHLP